LVVGSKVLDELQVVGRWSKFALGEASLDKDTDPETDVWIRKRSRSVLRQFGSVQAA
jgi:hypothetical protein